MKLSTGAAAILWPGSLSTPRTTLENLTDIESVVETKQI